MKTQTMTIVLLAALVMVWGCSKKDSPPQAGQETEDTQAPGMVESVKDTAAKDGFSMEIDLEATVADLKAEAAQMDIESLKEVAAKYKETIQTNEAEMKALMEKLSAIPLTEKLGDEAKALTADIKTLTDTVAALQERLGVYVDALKAKGADVKALLEK